MLKVIKINKGLFSVFEKEVKGSEIILDFNPFIEKNSLKQGLIVHLRARPPQQACYWTWGVYEVKEDKYWWPSNIQSFKESAPEFFSDCIPELETKPTHVLIYPFAKIQFLENGLFAFKSSNAVAKAVESSALKKSLK